MPYLADKKCCTHSQKLLGSSFACAKAEFAAARTEKKSKSEKKRTGAAGSATATRAL
jgi:hypothetical protein